MIRSSFDPKKPYRYVQYARMSDDKQNPRSPEQQFRAIQDTLERVRYDWMHVADYRDDAVKGRYRRKRAGFQKMLQDIKSGVLHVDLILVHTIERFARLEELPEIRRQLYDKHGVLVLAADTMFTDPTSPVGRVHASFEALRATEEGRIKAENVMRGKKDLVLLKRWPGGDPNFGYMLKKIVDENCRPPAVYSVLVPNPEESWIIQLLFQKARETGWGQARLTRFLNNHNRIPEALRRFQEHTVGYWLRNDIYYGTMVWPRHATDIVNDTRIVKNIPEEEQERVPDYCEPLISKELFDAVKQLREARSATIRRARAAKNSNPKLIIPRAPGLALTHPLTGLVRCGTCGRSMRPSVSGVYITKDEQQRRYIHYFCPGHISGLCPNDRRVPEAWLRELVIAKLRERLFPGV